MLIFVDTGVGFSIKHAVMGKLEGSSKLRYFPVEYFKILPVF